MSDGPSSSDVQCSRHSEGIPHLLCNELFAPVQGAKDFRFRFGIATGQVQPAMGFEVAAVAVHVFEDAGSSLHAVFLHVFV